MNVMVYNGYAVPVSGKYVDNHGHILFLRVGDLAPICPMMGPSTVCWRVVRKVPDTR
ncbi:hypothetical protein HQ535_07580 [bacterium]|nr:hypothetical protein [bacterium]